MSSSGTTSEASTSEASKLTDPARRAPATLPHTRLSAALGLGAASACVGLLVATRFDEDQRIGDRMLSLAVLGALLGLTYLATRLHPRLRESVGSAREAYRLGRRVERAVARRRSAH
jgi:hypothetical protein